MIASYQYHIFLSYSRRGDVPEWVKNHFLPVLERRLEAEFDETPRIFLDEQIDTGADWPITLADALHRSYCLLAIWSPSYFRSRWCMAEWQTMRVREEQLGLRTSANPSGLVYPVVYSDGDTFPVEAKRIQHRKDLKDYAYPYPQFRNSEKYLEFHDQVARIAQELVNLFNDSIPPWNPDWSICTPDPEPEPVYLFKRL
jgi:TIR domain